MASTQHEIELKYDVAADAALPPLDSLPGVAEAAGPVAQLLDAVYFDTADLALAAAGITVRCRTGGDDEGWHVKLPVSGGHRDEIQVPLGRARKSVPKALRTALRAHVHLSDMAAVATVRTERTVTRLSDADGRVLAEFCDDLVTASSPLRDPETTIAWREWEVELVAGDNGLLDAADELIRDAGADTSTRRSKLARALGDLLPEDASAAPTPLLRKGPAAHAVHARLQDQVAELKARDPQVRLDLPDGVHKMRVALRRLRSALATFRPLLDRDVTDPLRAEMKWIADSLGEARDAEVVRQRLRDAIAAEPAELVLGPVERRVDDELGGTYRTAHAAALEVMISERYFTLLDGLDALVADPPWTEQAQRPARDVLRRRVRRDWKRLRRRVDAAASAPTAERDQALHDVRKAAKRARYAAETLKPVYGKHATRLVTALERVQSDLGEHHDTVMSRPVLRRLGVEAYLDSDNGFTYGRLHAFEQDRAENAEARYATTWRKASHKKLRGWLAS